MHAENNTGHDSSNIILLSFDRSREAQTNIPAPGDIAPMRRTKGGGKKGGKGGPPHHPAGNRIVTELVPFLLIAVLGIAVGWFTVQATSPNGTQFRNMLAGLQSNFHMLVPSGSPSGSAVMDVPATGSIASAPPSVEIAPAPTPAQPAPLRASSDPQDEIQTLRAHLEVLKGLIAGAYDEQALPPTVVSEAFKVAEDIGLRLVLLEARLRDDTASARTGTLPPPALQLAPQPELDYRTPALPPNDNFDWSGPRYRDASLRL